jgi:hypothetical protein
VKIEWQNAPDNFNTYYTDYNDTSPSNKDFTFKIQLLYKKQWCDQIPADNYLFCSQDGTISKSEDGCVIKTIEVPDVVTDYKPYYTEIAESLIDGYYPDTSGGFIKIQLTGPTSPIIAFGHTDYPAIYTVRIINNTLPTDASRKTNIPKEPYTPAIKSISVNYYSSENIIDTAVNTYGVSNFYHIGPFGHEALGLNDFISRSVPLLPQFQYQGALFIGLKDLHPPVQLSLLFHVAEGSSDLAVKIRPAIKWCYLSGNNWNEMLPNQILMDTTQELRNSGVILFDIPKTASPDTSIMDKGYIWLRGSVENNAGAINQLIQIQTQAAIAGFINKNNDPNHLRQPLPANSITRLAINDPPIKTSQ